ncbi:SDR family NAD(P)-dependent oxidoreductase [Microbacterium sp. No. 7]|uniref:SDR family NAD(P)-dependent oxidoreductase n=1 Tax=Microbacterium sp. No. 7 TaxID=1714373 RepID=UPI0006D2392E|nr:SDR family NAD(P)-dependent oxidoreductase [Microbacterium sp. No. 7]ALJ20772.1 hypothetical protein AOA12_13020 [Microbacterium sp. No. 7]
MAERFAGKTAVVTGAGSGIGRAIAVALVQEGARVVANDIDEDAVVALADELGVENVVPLSGDTSDPATGAALVDAALGLDGRVDVVVNNAGVHRIVPAERFPIELWARTIDVNLSGYFYVAQAAAAPMIRQRGGAILNVASTTGAAAALHSAAYVASKHGVVGLTKALAVDWAPYGIRVNAIGPGLTRTTIVDEYEANAPELFAQRKARIPLGREATASEQAATALFLLSDESSHTTGQLLVVDGGGHALYSGYQALPLADPV